MPYETYKKDGNKYCVRKSDSKEHVGCSDKYHIGGYLAKLDSVSENELVGGKADNLTPKDIAKKFKVSVKYIKDQIKKGLKVEAEHTNDEKKKYEISIDHVSEFPDYYERIDKMEKEANKFWNEKLKKENMNETKILIKKHLRENFNKSSLESQIQKELQRLGLSPETKYYIIGKPIDKNIEEGIIDSLKKATVACTIAASGMLIGCQKDKPVVMYKYIYSDAGSKSYNEKNKTTLRNSALIPYDRVLSSKEIEQEQDKIANDYLNNSYKSIEVDTRTDTLVPQNVNSKF